MKLHIQISLGKSHSIKSIKIMYRISLPVVASNFYWANYPTDENYHIHYIYLLWASLVAQMVKNLAAMWKIQAQSLNSEDPMEKEMVTYSSVLAWRIPWTKKPDGLLSMGSQGVRHDWATELTDWLNAYIWNLKKWFWRTHLQGRNRNTDIENRLVDTVGEGEDRLNWESSIDLRNYHV